MNLNYDDDRIDDLLISQLISEEKFEEAIDYCLDNIIDNSSHNDNDNNTALSKKKFQYSYLTTQLTLAYLYRITKKQQLIIPILSKCSTILNDSSFTNILHENQEDLIIYIKCCLEIASMYYYLHDYNLAKLFYQRSLSQHNKLLEINTLNTNISLNHTITTSGEEYSMEGLITFLEIASKYGIGCSLLKLRKLTNNKQYPHNSNDNSNNNSNNNSYSNNNINNCNNNSINNELLLEAQSHFFDSIQYFETCIFTYKSLERIQVSNVNLHRILFNTTTSCSTSHDNNDNQDNNLIKDLSLNTHNVLYYLIDAYKYISECLVILEYWNQANQLLDRSIEFSNTLIVKLQEKDKNYWYQSLFLLSNITDSSSSCCCYHLVNNDDDNIDNSNTSIVVKINDMICILRKHRAHSYVAKALLYINQNSNNNSNNIDNRTNKYLALTNYKQQKSTYTWLVTFPSLSNRYHYYICIYICVYNMCIYNI